ncbi:MAG: MmcQ/YjbR family DNA-binding protein [Actinomycetota bacterium]
MRAATVRATALSLPDVEERETWGTATFRVRNKIFAMCSDNEREVWIKATHDEQRALIAMDPQTYFFPPYVGPSGWVGAKVRSADRDEIRELLTEAWRMTATKRAVKTFDDTPA